MRLQCRGSRQEPQNAVQFLQYYLRVAEFEAPEREREELLAELVPAMEAQGHDAGAVRRLAAGEGLAVPSWTFRCPPISVALEMHPDT
jgi:hypothetical protein